MLRFKCPHCGKAIIVKDESAGKKGKCPGCGEIIQVPVGPIPEQPEAHQPKPPPLPSQSEITITPSSDPTQHTPVPTQTVDVQPVSDHQPAPVIQTPATAIQVNVQQPSRAAHSLGISSLVLGILSFFVFWIPFIGLPLSGLGFLLGAIGLIPVVNRKGTGRGYSIAGTALNSFGLLFGIIFITFIAGRGSDEELSRREQELNRREEALRQQEAAASKPIDPVKREGALRQQVAAASKPIDPVKVALEAFPEFVEEQIEIMKATMKGKIYKTRLRSVFIKYTFEVVDVKYSCRRSEWKQTLAVGIINLKRRRTVIEMSGYDEVPPYLAKPTIIVTDFKCSYRNGMWQLDTE